MKASELLQLRRDELAFSDEVKWVNRCPQYGDGEVDSSREACLLIGGKYEMEVDSSYYLTRAMAETGCRAMGLASWNDTSGRTLAEVLALLDRAIILAKEAGD